jgi:replicative DNA helicase
LSELARSARDRLMTSESNGTGDTISTGFPSLDAKLGSGIRRGDLVILGGDVGSGKSALALSIALRAARGTGSAIFYSSEMKIDRVRERLIAMDRKVSFADLRSTRSGQQPNSAAAGSDLPREGEPDVRMVLPGTSVDAVVDEIRSDFDIDLVVVDHLQSLATDKRAFDEELAAAVRKLKSAALESGVAVLLVAHSSVQRDAGNVARPSLNDFGALGAVKQQADVVLAIYREEMYEQARGLDGATELHVLKNRHGDTGYVDLFFYKQWLRFEDMVEPGESGPP